MKLKIKKLRENAVLPTRGSKEAAGYDLYACIDEPVSIGPGHNCMIPTGLAMEIPEGYFGGLYARSGLACKRYLRPATGTSVIDSDYRGEIMVCLHNDLGTDVIYSNTVVYPGERIAQLVIQKFEEVEWETVEELESTERGVGGFGSTGV